MKKLGAWLAAAAVVALASCVTINIYFPAAAAERAADQVIEKISPNVSVMAFEPAGDPLGAFLASLARIRADIPQDVLTLAGHRLPFRGLHARCDDLAHHHQERCQIILDALAGGPHSAARLVPLMFPRDLTPHEMSFAFSETLAHTNYLVATGACAGGKRG